VPNAGKGSSGTGRTTAWHGPSTSTATTSMQPAAHGLGLVACSGPLSCYGIHPSGLAGQADWIACQGGFDRRRRWLAAGLCLSSGSWGPYDAGLASCPTLIAPKALPGLSETVLT
jgi:hypothetical protein